VLTVGVGMVHTQDMEHTSNPTTTTYTVKISTSRDKDFAAIVTLIKRIGLNGGTAPFDRGRKAWTVEVPTCTDQARIDRYGQAMADLAANALGASDLTFYAADLAITAVER